MLLYIHIPFCSSKCGYCSFNSFSTLDSMQESYVDALLEQLKTEIFDINKSDISSIYFGGGTPSTLRVALLEKIFHQIDALGICAKEVTIEANPNSSLKSWLESVKGFGATRLSFGIQSFDAKKLELLERDHDREIAIANLRSAAKIGFEKISVDFIYDLCCDTRELLQNDLSIATDLGVGHISAYSLMIEEGSRFAKYEELKKRDEELERRFIEEIEKNGFAQYEISNFGKTHKSQHNLGYWSGEEYIGVGAGAVGYREGKRRYPHTDVKRYIEEPLYACEEILSSEDVRLERIFLGLRSEVGVERSIVADIERVRVLEKDGFLISRGGRIYANDYMLADELALQLWGGS